MKRQYKRPEVEIISPSLLPSILSASVPSQEMIPFSNQTDADPDEEIL